MWEGRETCKLGVHSAFDGSLSLFSQPRILNLILLKFNSKVAHGRSHCQTTNYQIHTKYRSLFGKVTKNSVNNITAI